MRGDWQRGSGESRARAGAPFFWFAGPRDERGIWYTCIEGIMARPCDDSLALARVGLGHMRLRPMSLAGRLSPHARV